MGERGREKKRERERDSNGGMWMPTCPPPQPAPLGLNGPRRRRLWARRVRAIRISELPVINSDDAGSPNLSGVATTKWVPPTSMQA